jgi:hypothetical protein
MKVIVLTPKPAFALIILILQNLYCLPQVAINILNPPLTLPVIHNHFDTNGLIRKIKDFVNIGLDFDVIVRLKAAETPSILHISFEVEFLLSQPLNCLALN